MLCLLLFSGEIAPGSASGQSSKWIRLKTAHFDLLTTVGEREGGGT